MQSLSVGAAPTRNLWQGSALFGLESWGEEGHRIDRRHRYAAGLVTISAAEVELRMWPRTSVRHSAGHWHLVADNSLSRTLVVPLKPYVENEPAFAAFRSDPRIEELLERLGFEA